LAKNNPNQPKIGEKMHNQTKITRNQLQLPKLAKITTKLDKISQKSAKNKKNHILHQNTLPTSYHKNLFYLAFSNSYHKKSILGR
jgi:GTP-binding protein EngB required for normal cell division